MPLSITTGVANRLVAAGLVARKPARDDGLAAILEITDAGMERVPQLFNPVLQDVAKIQDTYGDDAIERITEGFRIVLALMETLESRVNAGERKS